MGGTRSWGCSWARWSVPEDGEGSVIGIRAEAGSGKTRLLEEMRSRLDDGVQWLEGRAYAYGENIPYAPLIDLISRAVDVGEDDTPESISRKLRAVIGPLVGDDESIIDPFDRLYGLREREGAALDNDSFQDRLLDSLVAVVHALCERAPTVLVFQDLHWADPSTLAIVDRLVTEITGACRGRGQLPAVLPGTLPGLREVELGPLSPRQTGQMLASLLDDDKPPDELVDFVVERTDGNPFFVEEIINSLIETGTLVPGDEGLFVVRLADRSRSPHLGAWRHRRPDRPSRRPTGARCCGRHRWLVANSSTR